MAGTQGGALSFSENRAELRQEPSAPADRARHGSVLLRQMGGAIPIRLTSCPTLPRIEASGESTASWLVGEIEIIPTRAHI